MRTTKRREPASYEDRRISIGGGGEIVNCLRANGALSATDNSLIVYEPTQLSAQRTTR